LFKDKKKYATSDHKGIAS